MVYEIEKEHKKTSLMCKKKEELAKEIMRLEHNVNVLNERLNVQANAIKRYEQESRNKAIDEMQGNLIRNSRTEVIDGEICLIVTDKRIKQIAEQMKKAGEENEQTD